VACDGNKWEGWLPLYTHPPRREQDDAEIAKLRAEVERLQQDYGRACKLVADMHAAATGRPGEGPRHGVVEDVAAVRAEVERLREALRIAEAALSDIGDADREPGDDVAWCEQRAAQVIPIARAALARKETT
jgi:hypothetical protein